MGAMLQRLCPEARSLPVVSGMLTCQPALRVPNQCLFHYSQLPILYLLISLWDWPVFRGTLESVFMAERVASRESRHTCVLSVSAAGDHGTHLTLLANHIFSHLNENDSFLLFALWGLRRKNKLMLNNCPHRVVGNPSVRALHTLTRVC